MALMGSGLRLLERTRAGVVHVDLKACSEYAPDPAKVAAISCPVLVVAGTRDLLTPVRAGTAVAAMLKGAKVVQLEGSGHAMTAEDPDGVLLALRGFLG
jgi:pimeloyl-ACP methyl ester carboxylesterase